MMTSPDPSSAIFLPKGVRLVMGSNLVPAWAQLRLSLFWRARTQKFEMGPARVNARLGLDNFFQNFFENWSNMVDVSM